MASPYFYGDGTPIATTYMQNGSAYSFIMANGQTVGATNGTVVVTGSNLSVSVNGNGNTIIDAGTGNTISVVGDHDSVTSGQGTTTFFTGSGKTFNDSAAGSSIAALKNTDVLVNGGNQTVFLLQDGAVAKLTSSGNQVNDSISGVGGQTVALGTNNVNPDQPLNFVNDPTTDYTPPSAITGAGVASASSIISTGIDAKKSRSAVKRPRRLLLQRLLPSVNPLRLNLMALGKVRHRHVPTDRLQRNPRLQRPVQLPSRLLRHHRSII